MAVFRVEKNKGYTVMSNHHLRNKVLSLKAKGLLSQMLSLPEDWDYTLKGLSLINRESIDAIRTAVWELERAGYIRREQGRDAKGKMADMVYTIYEQPVLDKPMSGNPTQLNKEIQRTNLPRKEKLNTDGQSTDSIPFPSLTPAPARNEAAAAPPERKGTRKDAAVQIYREILLENIEYDYLIQDSSIDREQLDEIVDLMLETVCTSRKSIRIAGDDYPAELVKSKFMKLTRAQRKEIDAVIRKYKGDGKPHTAQATIPYEAMYPDGVCRLTKNTFSKCIAFEDISYQLAQPDTKTAIFEHLCDLYNYVDASIHVQFSFLNRRVDPVQYAKSFEIAPQGDDFDDIRAEYTGIMQKQLANGNNGIVKTKYLTFTIEVDSPKSARARLNRIGLDLLGYFKTMGAVAHVMNGKERLAVLHGVFHPDGELFNFDWKWMPPSGLSTKDFIAPSSLCFGNAKTLGMGGKYGAVSFLQILAPELSDEMLADFLNTDSSIRHHKLKPYRAAEKAERQALAANAEYFYQKSLRDNPEIAQAATNPVSRFWQKQQIKRQYAKAARTAGQTAGAAAQGAGAAAQGAAKTAASSTKAAKAAAEESKRAASFVARHWKGSLAVLVLVLLLLMVLTGLQSCTAMFGSAGGGIAASSYFSEESDMLAAEDAYATLEAELQAYLDNYEATHDYDEYHFDLDSIEHDPYVLISILSALHDEQFTIGEVRSDLQMLFDKQYILTETVVVETRYRTETDTWTYADGNTHTDTYEVPYDYYICTVTLENFNLSHVPVYIMDEETLSAYSLYMSTLGNRPDLFSGSQYPHASTLKEPTYYDVPPEALEDERFAAMLKEAENYIGYPYVWDGWGRRAYTTSVPLFPVRRPSPATLCFLSALMTPLACPTSACMWAIR